MTDKQTNNVDEEDESSLKTLGFLIVVVFGVWLLGALPLWLATDPGKIGDTFGAVNALFSGLAFAGVAYAILLQRKELKLQQEELRETRTELKAQTLHFEKQNRTLSQQAADGTFFQLLRLHAEIVNAIDIVRPNAHNEVVTGRDSFEVLFRKLEVQYRNTPKASDDDRIRSAYADFYESNQADLGHYFRSIYNIVKFVKTSQLEDKRMYTNLVRAQLSSYELLILFYNCISVYGEAKFKPLVEEYGLLKHLSKDHLFHENQTIMYFRAGAFA